MLAQENHPNDKTNGRWTKEEHEKFMLGTSIFIQVLNYMEKIGEKSRNWSLQETDPKSDLMLKNTS